MQSFEIAPLAMNAVGLLGSTMRLTLEMLDIIKKHHVI